MMEEQGDKIIQNYIIKLNIGGTLFQTTWDTLNRFGSNFLTQLTKKEIPSLSFPEGYFFVDRSCHTFQILLDYLRTGVLRVPPTIYMESIIDDATFFSINLDAALFYDLEEGCYNNLRETDAGKFSDVILITRDTDQPWYFIITGILKEDRDRHQQWVQYWKKRCPVINGVIVCDNFEIVPSNENGPEIIVKQKNIAGEERRLELVSPIQPQVTPKVEFLKATWVGSRFMDNSNYMLISFVPIKSEDSLNIQWIGSITCGNHIIRQVEVVTPCEAFFLITIPNYPNESFWVFVHQSAERLLCYNPVWARDKDETFIFEKGWVRFKRKLN